MPCTPLPGGGFACTSGKRPRCKACGYPAPFLCDWKLGAKTCDAPICARCSTRPAPDKDLCPAHAEAWKAWLAARPRSNSSS